jgi:hypothetical protein
MHKPCRCKAGLVKLVTGKITGLYRFGFVPSGRYWLAAVLLVAYGRNVVNLFKATEHEPFLRYLQNPSKQLCNVVTANCISFLRGIERRFQLLNLYSVIGE